MPDLEALIPGLTGNEKLGQSEAATRLWALDPVLEALGWRLRDPDQVEPEYSVRGGSVDYCLRGNRRNLVLIEAKRAGTDLTGHQEQILRYAFNEGTPLAALTDGLVWWLYLPRASGNWEQRRFLSLDFRQLEAVRAAADLRRFLGRDAVVSGGALEAAQREFDSQDLERRVGAALQVAWKQVLSDPDGLLIDLVADAVKDEVGDHPGRETVRQFLLGRLRQEPVAPEPPRRRRRRTGSGGGARPTAAADADYTGKRPAAFLLNGVRHEATRWRAVLAGTCELLVQEAGLRRFTQAVEPIRGKRRVLFSADRSQLHTPTEIAEGRFFVEGNVSAAAAVRRAREVLIAVRGPHGAEGFAIEPASPRRRPRADEPKADRTARTDRMGKRPAAFLLDGVRHEAARWRDVLTGTCELLVQEAGAEFGQRVADIRGRNRPYFSEDPNQLLWPLRLANSDLFVEGKFSATATVRLARRVIEAVRGPQGADSFAIEPAE